MNSFLARRARLPHRLDQLVTPRLVLVMGALFVLLLMPVGYRAGTTDVHLHSIYQPLLDDLFGPHHHHDSAPTTRLSPFSRPGLPLVSTTSHTTPSEGADAPHQMHWAANGLFTTSLLGLAVLIATLLAGSSPRHLWTLAHRLRETVRELDTPPPRLGT